MLMPHLVAVAKERLELRQFQRGCDNEDVANTCKH